MHVEEVNVVDTYTRRIKLGELAVVLRRHGVEVEALALKRFLFETELLAVFQVVGAFDPSDILLLESRSDVARRCEGVACLLAVDNHAANHECHQFQRKHG